MENIYTESTIALNPELINNDSQPAFNGNDVKSFTALYHQHVNMMYNYGVKLTTDTELLKDCIQDVFIKIYHKRSEIENIQNLKSYLLISLKNKLCDESRKRIHLSDVAIEELSVVAAENVEKDFIAAESTFHIKAMVCRLMDKLSPRQRNAIELYYIQEKKYEEICEIMNMNYQSVRNLIHRGILKLRVAAV